ncbi:response regulator [Cognatilysobacter terrigena]|uniref:response regulator n=1 Tax=Cognatilysobacter terrigena TaxID=2488749 RepID=UPI001415310C|nr:response regulator [Lysobacter terrigena]
MSDNDTTSPVSAPATILLVDDQPGRLLSYRAILEPLGENLIEARSGVEALRLLMEHECALILLDVNMPGMDGFETASLIHQHPRYEKTPIIFVTAVNVSDLDRLRGYKLGAVDYVMVPVIPEIMRSKVSVLVELYRKRRELQNANELLAQANEDLRLEKARELEALNESLRNANVALAQRNIELQAQVSERERVQQRLLEHDRRKDQFLATLAHELRNPLASLANAVNVMKLGGQTGPRLYDAMDRQLVLLVRLIDDLLDVARISQDKLVLRQAATTIDAVLHSAVESVTAMLQAAGHQLEVHVPPVAVPLDADPERLSQVFANLISNAAKYSDSASPIRVDTERDGDHVLVHVTDRGIGLAPEQVDAIFEPFAQVDTSIERARGGLGIGLTLVRRLVEMHGGAVTASSEGLGHGSRFTVRLPIGRGQALPDRTPEPLQAASPRRVLVVDDNCDSADTLAMMLEMLGHQAQRIYDPHAAEQAVTSFEPDVVFLDIGMPGISGYDVARRLRASPLGAAMTLVAVTGWGQPEDRQRTADAGFDHHLVKPPEIEAICRILGALPSCEAKVP